MHALDFGRLSVACGALGLAQACLDASHAYAKSRVQFGVPILEHQLVARMITDMIAGVRAARLLCREAARLRARRDPAATVETMIAKYQASRLACAAAADAVQIHGANGIGADYPVQRFLRDARVLEIIEGSTQLQQIMIARNAAVEQRPTS
jgi:alkylation response protein AidB-like acyl-CoA dehydrogenase